MASRPSRARDPRCSALKDKVITTIFSLPKLADICFCRRSNACVVAGASAAWPAAALARPVGGGVGRFDSGLLQ
eukprot:scaffold45243_cov25-Phaeocystis_antarctica.AAC.1